MKTLNLKIKHCNDYPYYRINITYTGYRCNQSGIPKPIGKYEPFQKIPDWCPLIDIKQ